MKMLYNVTVKIESDVHEDWLDWMKKKHVHDVMATQHFESYKITKIIGDEDEHGICYAIQYLAKDEASFTEYQNNHAKRLQKDHADRYPNKYVAFRTLMEVVDEG